VSRLGDVQQKHPVVRIEHHEAHSGAF